jgi:hypothetical protein
MKNGRPNISAVTTSLTADDIWNAVKDKIWNQISDSVTNAVDNAIRSALYDGNKSKFAPASHYHSFGYRVATKTISGTEIAYVDLINKDAVYTRVDTSDAK